MTDPTDLFQLTRHEGHVTEIALNRAPVNALSPAFLMGFAALLDRLEAEEDTHAVVLSSPFKVFSAGLDLKEAQQFDLAQEQAIVEGLNMGFLRLFTFAKPVVAAINGPAIAGGLFFVLASDFRVAGPRASFGLAEVRVGADFPVGPMEIARATLGPNALRRMMLTGQPIPVDQARDEGLVDVLEDDRDRVLSRAIDEAARLGRLPSIAYASIKRQIREPAVSAIESAVAQGANAPVDGWFNAQTRDAMRRMIG
ncbi:enoyl-CoA hydratase/isomerase family protein [Pseudodonghicola flavimaris]|uniref:Enoyl-CoA hydratase/isomerase family protein n=1 Tax=Pseudodonghicola flavimaris TaxID=3050036 RepID=A0ABT7F0X5_9RHOB|nr:enoyl-CoA hydratase/isomerase family protein [Pseudodonghicola flavimaris]MDK3018268.1 enoyl-CoA hydratase/isomerase family protein [Pseudodonghicola flavimaris]